MSNSLLRPDPHSSLFDFRRDMPGFLAKIAKKYGDIVYFKLGPQKAFLLNHPDFINGIWGRVSTFDTIEVSENVGEDFK